MPAPVKARVEDEYALIVAVIGILEAVPVPSDLSAAQDEGTMVARGGNRDDLARGADQGQFEAIRTRIPEVELVVGAVARIDGPGELMLLSSLDHPFSVDRPSGIITATLTD